MTNTATGAKLLTAVTFAPNTRYGFTLAAGSVVNYAGASLNGPCAIRVEFAGKVATISTDDAVPVYWDEVEEMWVEE